MPGQTQPTEPTGFAGTILDTFNGGPGNCPAKRRRRHTTAHRWCYALQWRAGQLPGQTARPPSTTSASESPLQWRAGQLPGQTDARRRRDPPPVTFHGSLQWRAGQLPGQTSRVLSESIDCARDHAFNGGPGNCPAKLARGWAGIPHRSWGLQWRAGQLPGQTSIPASATSFNAVAAKRVRVRSLQWRAGQLPGQTAALTSAAASVRDPLQWRAGQLPGQTCDVAMRRPSAAARPFNGGPGNCPAKPRGAERVAGRLVDPPSMEGRAIARPNPML